MPLYLRTALPSPGNLTVHSKRLSSLQIEGPADTTATHQTTQTGCMASWKLFDKTIETQMCVYSVLVTSTGTPWR